MRPAHWPGPNGVMPAAGRSKKGCASAGSWQYERLWFLTEEIEWTQFGPI